MAIAPKPRRPRSRGSSPDGASITGRRRAPAGRVLQRSGDRGEDARLETFEQDAERGSEDARLLVDARESLPKNDTP